MATQSQFRRAVQRWRICYYFSKLRPNCVSENQVSLCAKLVKIVKPTMKTSNVLRAVRSYAHYLNNISFYMSLSLFRTYVSLDQHLGSYGTCSSAQILTHINDVIGMLRTLVDDKNAENEHRKDFILNNIGLTETQTHIVQMILNDTTVLSDNTALWTCVERSVECMLQRIAQERQNGTFDTFFRFMFKMRCALLSKCSTNVKRQHHVNAILSLERIQGTIGSETMIDDALSLILSASTYITSDISTLQTHAESSNPGRHARFIIECHYVLGISLF